MLHLIGEPFAVDVLDDDVARTAIDPEAARPASRWRRRREGPQPVASVCTDRRGDFPEGSAVGAGEGAGLS